MVLLGARDVLLGVCRTKDPFTVVSLVSYASEGRRGNVNLTLPTSNLTGNYYICVYVTLHEGAAASGIFTIYNSATIIGK